LWNLSSAITAIMLHVTHVMADIAVVSSHISLVVLDVPLVSVGAASELTA
jgi:hypothetical protein